MKTLKAILYQLGYIFVDDSEIKGEDLTAYNWLDDGNDNWIVAPTIKGSRGSGGQLFHFVKEGVIREGEKHQWMGRG